MKERNNMREIFDLTSPPGSNSLFAAKVKSQLEGEQQAGSVRSRNSVFVLATSAVACAILAVGAVFAMGGESGFTPLASDTPAVTTRAPAATEVSAETATPVESLCGCEIVLVKTGDDNIKPILNCQCEAPDYTIDLPEGHWANAEVSLNIAGETFEFTVAQFYYARGVVTVELGFEESQWDRRWERVDGVWDANHIAVISSNGHRIGFDICGESIEYFEFDDGMVRVALVLEMEEDDVEAASFGLEYLVINEKELVLVRG